MKYSHVLALAASAGIFAGCAFYHENFQGAEPISFNQMTIAAQVTARKEIGNQPIANITRDYRYGDPTYRIEVERPTVNPTLWVAYDGSIIKESRRLIGANMPPVYEPAGAKTTTSASASTTSSAQNSTCCSEPSSQSKTAHSPKQSSGSNY